MVEHERTGPVDILTWSFSRIAMWAPAFIVVIIFYEVIMRYVFFQPTLWVNEMSLWVGGAIYVTAGLYAMQQRSHIRIFVLYDMVPRWLQWVFDLVSTLCVCIFTFAVIWGGYGEALAKFWRWETFGTAFDPPIPATNKPLILVTLLVLALQAVSNLIRDWTTPAWVRKAFDLASVLAVIWVVIMGAPALFAFGEGAPTVPVGWRIGIGATMVVSIALMLAGLMRDYNRTPAPEAHLDAIAEELEHIPDEILTGDPPRERH